MIIIIISGEKGAGYSSKISMLVMQVVLAMTEMALQFAYNIMINRKLQPNIQVLKIHIMKRSHASMVVYRVTVDTDKCRLVEIPPSSREPPDIGLTRIQ